MLKALIKTRLISLLSSMLKGSAKKRSGPGMKVLYILLGIYLIGCFAFLFGSLFNSLCVPLHSAGLGWLYFALAALISTALCFFGSVFATQSQLYDAKDNELLLSMPVPPMYILASRMVLVLALNYMYELLVMLPCVFVYSFHMGAELTVAKIGLILLGLILLPLIATTLACAFGWLLALVSSKLRNKNIVPMIMSLAFLAVYFYAYSRVGTYINQLIANGAAIGDAIQKALPPMYSFGAALAEADFAGMGEFLLWSVIPFAVVYAVLSRSFIRITTAKKGAAKKQYRRRAMKVRTPRRALVQNELRHFWSNPMYVMNGALGSVFVLIIAAAVVIKRSELPAVMEQMPALEAYLPALAAAALSLMASMTIISAPSISLEAKTLWIPQSFPAAAGDVLIAKAGAHMIVALPPALAASLACAAVMGASAAETVLLVLLPAAANVFCAFFGVVVNLRFPKFDWLNETIAIKQGMSVIIAMMAPMGLMIGLAALYLALRSVLPVNIYITVVTVLLAALSAAMRLYLYRGGAKRFMEL